MTTALLLAALALGAPSNATAQTPAGPVSASPPLLIVLAPTGVERDGLPVYTRHPNSDAYEAVLGGGFSGRLLRLYRWVQQFRAMRDGTTIEPACLLLSRNEGGFPRYGFWLDAEKKAGVGYVDLHERLDGSGRFGAIDQIFPHELMHVILHQLTGLPPAGTGGANQIHAVGVRTDRVTAFDEGFAEHAQVLAIDDPDARPRTAALKADTVQAANADLRLERYRRALGARWAPAPPARMSFVLWFSQTEQALRYHAVKANRFAREPSIRTSRFTGADLYRAYLLENILPGTDADPVKSTPRLLSTEGVVSSLFANWVMDPAMQRPAPAALYARFGVRAEDVSPIERAYVKLFSVFADRQPHDVAAVVRGYVGAFPDETEAIGRLMRRTGFEWPIVDVPEIWLANDAFMTGTTLFDQYRGQPRVHTFDMNAASLVDLLTVDGMSVDLATAIQRGAPYASLSDLQRVPGVSSRLHERFQAMERGMAAVREANARHDIESIDFRRLLRPVVLRGLAWVLACALGAAFLYGLARRLRVWRLAINGVAAAVVGLISAWVLGAALQVGDRPVDPTMLVFLPIVVVGAPAALWQLAWRRAPKEAGRVLAAWTLACVPGWLIITPLF